MKFINFSISNLNDFQSFSKTIANRKRIVFVKQNRKQITSRKKFVELFDETKNRNLFSIIKLSTKIDNLKLIVDFQNDKFESNFDFDSKFDFLFVINNFVFEFQFEQFEIDKTKLLIDKQNQFVVVENLLFRF